MNIILDPIFILLLKPYGMGIDGAAYATVVSQIAYAMDSLASVYKGILHKTTKYGLPTY